MLPDVKMTPVKSSTISLVGYDQKAGDLHIKFKSGGDTYVYHGVPLSTFSAFMNSPSKGKFHADHIRGTKDVPDKKFKFSKLPNIPPQL